MRTGLSSLLKTTEKGRRTTRTCIRYGQFLFRFWLDKLIRTLLLDEGSEGNERRTNDQVVDVLDGCIASSEVAELAGVVVPAFVKATALNHRVAGHEEAPPNPSDDGAEEVGRATGARQARVLILVRFLAPSSVVIALPMTHFSPILLFLKHSKLT